MYIKSIELDGFKSYREKTKISGFDPSFNAITGLNGSGKSNILDAICFVLGISTPKLVRATTFTELVYKSGQAGVNKAEVTVLFDNRDRRYSPPGFEDHKEITVSRVVTAHGKWKYTINGSVAQNNKVQDFFKSVKLNVNNPHFLIMQGRISKVLNMKPLEVLGMLEEAVGTKLYEEKKSNAVKSLMKNDEKLNATTDLMDNQIGPQLERLHKDRTEFQNFKKVERQFVCQERLVVAWIFCCLREAVQQADGEKEELDVKHERYTQKIKDLEADMRKADEDIEKFQNDLQTEGQAKMKILEEQLKQKQLDETRAAGQVANYNEALKCEESKLVELKANLKEEEDTRAQKFKELETSQAKLEKLSATAESDKGELEKAEKDLFNINAGFSTDGGEETTLAQQMMDANQKKCHAETQIRVVEKEVVNLKKKLVEQKEKAKKADASYNKDKASYDKLAAEATRLQEEASKQNYEKGSLERIQEAKNNLHREKNDMEEKYNRLLNKHNMAFHYSDPVPNFDRRKVLGPVALNLTLKDARDALALDVTAGSRLHQVIIDTEETGKLLLSKGRLARRVTFIPINKIEGRRIDNAVLQRAKQAAAPANVVTALSRINYEPRLTACMEYVFGSTLICDDVNSALKVVDKVQNKCVTYEGDVCDPTGPMSGGSKGAKGDMLADINTMSQLKEILENKENELKALLPQLDKLRIKNERHREIVEEYELAENKAQSMKASIEQSTHYKDMMELEEMKKSLEEKTAAIKTYKETVVEKEKLIKELEGKSAKNVREAVVKAAETHVSKCKKKSADSQNKLNEFKQIVNALEMEVESIDKELPTYQKQIEERGKVIVECEEKLKEITEIHKNFKEETSHFKKTFDEQKTANSSKSREINKIIKEKDNCAKEISDIDLKLKQLDLDMKNHGNNALGNEKKLKDLISSHKFIEEEKQYFGTKNTEFDFEKYNHEEATKMLEELKGVYNQLKQKVNMKATNMLTSIEDEYEKLKEKKESILKDKATITGAIADLDTQKREALDSACVTVDKDFGSIFSTLLPGAQAKLAPSDGECFLNGIEFKIGFGDIWKESLGELSGGQRSLVALSFILALLRYHPAPLYILDEVDAALDLSHTQNIGKMLKLHFKESQFIIVSLKEGMFNNANVLYRAQFVDGTSVVTCTRNNR